MWEVSVPLLVFLLIAAVTDVRSHMIYNWNTYSGLLFGLLLNAFVAPEPLDGLWFGLKGFLLCGGIMLVCFVFFSMGGGDVKLIAMIGAFLGPELGIMAMLWTFVLGAIMGIAILVWTHGFFHLLKGGIDHAKLVAKTRTIVPLTEEEREPLKRWLFLAPAALAGVLLVMGEFWLRSR